MFAMDFLKKELDRKRKQVQTNFGGCKFMKRSEIEQKEIERIREEEQQELHLKTLRKNASENADKQNASAPLKSDKSKASAASGEEELRIDELVLPRAEVIRRLRILKQPITLFGEDDEARLDRLKILLKSGIVDVDSDMTEGQRNDFLRDLAELKRKEKSGMVMKRKKAEKEKEGEDVKDKEGLDDPDNGGSSGVDCDKDFKKMKANFDELCDEDKILVFFKRLLDEWEQELEDRPEAEKRTGKGKSMYATFKQCARYLTPLFNFCRKKALPDDIKQALLIIVECCIKRDYLAAMDQYIKLAIGNAPWPIGVTMVGIHERSAREKIYTNSVAHIMNDETTRKYLQSVKRLMTLCQRRYPSLPSKSVEFNSLANGSDLQSLLAEEKQKGAGQNIEEKLRLTAA